MRREEPLAVGQVGLGRAGDPVHHPHRLDRVAGRPRSPRRASPRRCRRRSRWRRRSPRPGSGAARCTIEASIWVAVIAGFERWPAARISRFCTTGTSRQRHFDPEVAAGDHDPAGRRRGRSPRRSRPPAGFSILAISGMSEPSASQPLARPAPGRRRWRRRRRRAGRRRCSTANSTQPRSPPVVAGRSAPPGMFIPLCEERVPPTSTSAVDPVVLGLADPQPDRPVGEVDELVLAQVARRPARRPGSSPGRPRPRAGSGSRACRSRARRRRRAARRSAASARAGRRGSPPRARPARRPRGSSRSSRACRSRAGVGEVEAEDVGAGRDQLLEHAGSQLAGPDRGDDLGPPLEVVAWGSRSA